VPLITAGRVLQTLLAVPGASALVLTEINPTHDPTGQHPERYVDTVTDSIARSLRS
jgi:arginase